MNIHFCIGILILKIFISPVKVNQELVSHYHTNNKTEKLILDKVRALPEIKEWFRTTKKSKPDLIFNKPDKNNKLYSVQVGLSNLGMFRTNYYFFIDPNTLQIYFWDVLDETGNGIISLQQWRRWRNDPDFHKGHIYQNGKLTITNSK